MTIASSEGLNYNIHRLIKAICRNVNRNKQTTHTHARTLQEQDSMAKANQATKQVTKPAAAAVVDSKPVTIDVTTVNGVELPSNVAAKVKELGDTSKSAQIRYLDSLRVPRGHIAKILEIKYQHVRNVLVTPVKTPKAAKEKGEVTKD